jgi:hypothetical protein
VKFAAVVDAKEAAHSDSRSAVESEEKLLLLPSAGAAEEKVLTPSRLEKAQLEAIEGADERPFALEKQQSGRRRTWDGITSTPFDKSPSSRQWTATVAEAARLLVESEALAAIIQKEDEEGMLCLCEQKQMHCCM